MKPPLMQGLDYNKEELSDFLSVHQQREVACMGGNSCSRVGFMSCQAISIQLNGLIRTQFV